MMSYIQKGKGGIYWSSGTPKGENPLNLALKSAKRWPDYFKPWIERVASVEQQAIAGIFSKIPEAWISSTASEFAQILLHHSQLELTQSL